MSYILFHNVRISHSPILPSFFVKHMLIELGKAPSQAHETSPALITMPGTVVLPHYFGTTRVGQDVRPGLNYFKKNATVTPLEMLKK